MKIKISPDDREKIQAALADLAVQCDGGIQLVERFRRMTTLNQEVKKRVSALMHDIDPTDDKAVMSLILERERGKIAGEACSAAQWTLEHSEDGYSEMRRAALGLVAGPLNDILGTTVAMLEKKLAVTVGDVDARKFAETAAPVAQLREVLAKGFVSEQTTYDMHLEACQRIRIFLTAYLSGEWDQDKVFAEMNAVGRAAA